MLLAKLDEVWLKTPPIRKRLIDTLLKNLKKRGVSARFYDTRILSPQGKDVLKTTFGVKAVYDAESLPLEFDKWVEALTKHMDRNKTYRLLVNRGNKKYPRTSIEIMRHLVKTLQQKGYSLDLKTYDETLWLEIRKDRAFLLWGEERGPGGLPYGSQGKSLSLFSGGIDSPVASWMIAKRGVALDYLFFSHTNTLDEEVKKVWVFLKDQWGMEGTLYMFKGRGVVSWIKDNVPRKFRMVAFKAFLYRVAHYVGKKTKAEALVTGESLNQVSTQTLGTLPAIDSQTSLLVLRPLIGMDKEETKIIARQIGTLELSEKVAERCQLAKKVVTKISKEKLEKLTSKFPLTKEYVEEHLVVIK